MDLDKICNTRSFVNHRPDAGPYTDWFCGTLLQALTRLSKESGSTVAVWLDDFYHKIVLGCCLCVCGRCSDLYAGPFVGSTESGTRNLNVDVACSRRGYFLSLLRNLSRVNAATKRVF